MGLLPLEEVAHTPIPAAPCGSIEPESHSAIRVQVRGREDDLRRIQRLDNAYTSTLQESAAILNIVDAELQEREWTVWDS